MYRAGDDSEPEVIMAKTQRKLKKANHGRRPASAKARKAKEKEKDKRAKERAAARKRASRKAATARKVAGGAAKTAAGRVKKKVASERKKTPARKKAAAKAVKDKGATRVLAVATHPIFSGPALQRLRLAPVADGGQVAVVGVEEVGGGEPFRDAGDAKTELSGSRFVGLEYVEGRRESA